MTPAGSVVTGEMTLYHWRKRGEQAEGSAGL